MARRSQPVKARTDPRFVTTGPPDTAVSLEPGTGAVLVVLCRIHVLAAAGTHSALARKADRSAARVDSVYALLRAALPPPASLPWPLQVTLTRRGGTRPDQPRALARLFEACRNQVLDFLFEVPGCGYLYSYDPRVRWSCQQKESGQQHSLEIRFARQEHVPAPGKESYASAQ